MANPSPLERVNNESSDYRSAQTPAAPVDSTGASALPPAIEEMAGTNDTAAIDPIAAQMEKFRVSRLALDAQITKMKAALQQRQKLPFDPVMLEVARQAATPSKTGSGIEGIGRIAGAYGDAYTKEQLRKEAIAQANLTLSEKQFELQKQDMAQQALYSFANNRTMGAPEPSRQAGAPSAGKTNAGALSTSSSVTPPLNDTPPSGGMRRITDQDIVQMEIFNPEAAETLRKTAKMQRDALVVTNEGVFNTMTGKFEVNFDMPIKRPYRVLGDVEMTKAQSKQYDAMMRGLDERGATNEQKDKAAADFAAQNGIGGVSISSDGTVSGFLSPRDKANRNEQDKATIANRADENKATRTMIYSAGQRAQSTKQQAQVLYKLSTDPTTRNAFGVLNKPGVLNAFAQAVSQGVQAGGSTIAFPGLETAVRNAGGTQQEINAAIMAAQAQSALQLMAAQDFLKGQGAVSDAERKLISNLAGSLADTPVTMAMKAKVIEARANYDKMISDAFYEYEEKHPNATAQEFYRKSPQFKELFTAYDTHMTKLYDHYFGSKSSNKPPAKSSANPREAGPLEQRLLKNKRPI